LIKLVHIFSAENSGPKIWSASMIFEKLPRENNPPTGEKSPNRRKVVQSGHPVDIIPGLPDAIFSDQQSHLG
jgi:acyl-homoserine lactone acylase PvdQ